MVEKERAVRERNLLQTQMHETIEGYKEIINQKTDQGVQGAKSAEMEKKIAEVDNLRQHVMQLQVELSNSRGGDHAEEIKNLKNELDFLRKEKDNFQKNSSNASTGQNEQLQRLQNEVETLHLEKERLRREEKMLKERIQCLEGQVNESNERLLSANGNQANIEASNSRMQRDFELVVEEKNRLFKSCETLQRELDKAKSTHEIFSQRSMAANQRSILYVFCK
eukprot:GHVL01026612.1.p3 GENE.GHVL01026612.1~~GHVL01026612.1.p3  ORF type:complete len:223 (-),score=60.78 GHVL01026612.1:2561-3229(-)